MKAETQAVMPIPEWRGDALVARCAKCWEHPGSKQIDGSGLCEGCGGAGFKVLATRPPSDESETE